MKRRVFLSLIIAGLLVTTTASRARTSAPQQPALASVVSIPFELATRHIMVKVKIGDTLEV